jgi:mevalonate kinase
MQPNSQSDPHSPASVSGWGCAKVILVGEHFVVHGAPALALPLDSVGTRVTLRTADEGKSRLELPEAAKSDKSKEVVDRAFAILGLSDRRHDWNVGVESTVPLGQGLGSSASYGLALLRALAEAIDRPLSCEQLSEHAYEIEKIFHGRPSGVDNTVIAYEIPVIFSANEGIDLLRQVTLPRLILASTGTAGSTQDAVAKVRQHRQENTRRFRALCDEAKAITESCASLLQTKFGSDMGREMGKHLDHSHRLLQEVGVSTIELDCLVDTARNAGAYGAKLTGAGFGGFMLAAIDPTMETKICKALEDAGAKHIIAMGGSNAS